MALGQKSFAGALKTQVNPSVEGPAAGLVKNMQAMQNLKTSYEANKKQEKTSSYDPFKEIAYGALGIKSEPNIASEIASGAANVVKPIAKTQLARTAFSPFLQIRDSLKRGNDLAIQNYIDQKGADEITIARNFGINTELFYREPENAKERRQKKYADTYLSLLAEQQRGLRSRREVADIIQKIVPAFDHYDNTAYSLADSTINMLNPIESRLSEDRTPGFFEGPGLSDLKENTEDFLVRTFLNTAGNVAEEGSVSGGLKRSAGEIFRGAGKQAFNSVDEIITGAGIIAWTGIGEWVDAIRNSVGRLDNKQSENEFVKAIVDSNVEKRYERMMALAPDNELETLGAIGMNLVEWSSLAGLSERYIAKRFLKGVNDGLVKNVSASVISDLSVFALVNLLQDAALGSPQLRSWITRTFTEAGLGVTLESLFRFGSKLKERATAAKVSDELRISQEAQSKRLAEAIGDEQTTLIESLTGISRSEPEFVETAMNFISRNPELKELEARVSESVPDLKKAVAEDQAGLKDIPDMVIEMFGSKANVGNFLVNLKRVGDKMKAKGGDIVSNFKRVVNSDEIKKLIKSEEGFIDKGLFGMGFKDDPDFSRIEADINDVLKNNPPRGGSAAAGEEFSPSRVSTQPEEPNSSLRGGFNLDLALKEDFGTPEIKIPPMEGFKNKKKASRAINALLDLGARRVDTIQFGDKSIKINPVERAIGTGQSEVFELERRGKNLMKMFKGVFGNEALSNKELSEAMYNYRDSFKPLPAKFEEPLGDLKKLVAVDQKFIAGLLRDKELVERIWDADTYVKRGYVNLDGSEISSAKWERIQLEAPEHLKADIIRIASGGGGNLSTKMQSSKERRFVTADDADEWGAQYGIKVDRDYFKSHALQRRDLSRILFNHEFKKSLRADAKDASVPGIQESFDPDDLVRFRENLLDETRAFVSKELEQLRDAKKIKDEEYKAKKEELVNAFEKEKRFLKENLPDDPSDLKIAKTSYVSSRENLMNILRDTKASLTDSAKTRIDSFRSGQKESLQQKYKRIGRHQADLKENGYVPIPDVVISNQLRGIMVTPELGKSIKNIFEKLPPSSVEDAMITLKFMMANLDAFQLKNVGEAKFGVSMDSLFKTWGVDETRYVERGKFWTKNGLILDRPDDINTKILSDLNREWKLEEQSGFAKFVSTLDKKTEGPLVKPIKKILGKTIEKLDEIQFEVAMPFAKLEAAESIYKKKLELFPDKPKEELAFETADFVNSAFQGQNWKMIMARHPGITKQVRRNLRYTFFGPDKMTSVAKQMASLVSGPNKKLAAMWYAKSIMLSLFITEALQYMISGHSTLQNRRGNEYSLEIPGIEDEKGNPAAIQIGGNSFELIKLLDKGPTAYLLNKKGSLANIAGDYLFPRYGDRSLTRILSDNAPIPFTAQSLVSEFWDMTQGLLGIEDKSDYADPETMVDAVSIFGMEFIGFPVVFRSGGSKQARLTDWIRGEAAMADWLQGNESSLDKKNNQTYNKPTKVRRSGGSNKGSFLDKKKTLK